MSCHEPLLHSHTAMPLLAESVLPIIFSPCLLQEHNVPFTPFHLEQVTGRHNQKSPKVCAAKMCREDAVICYSQFSLVFLCCLLSIAYTLLNKWEKGKSMTQAFQINYLFFKQGSDWGTGWNRSSVTRVTWCQQFVCQPLSEAPDNTTPIISTVCATSSFLKSGTGVSPSATAEITCCCTTHQWITTWLATASLDFVLEIQEKSSGLALQALLCHIHQALKCFSIITLCYFTMGEELSLGQVPLDTIYAPLFLNASTSPHAFMASPWCPSPFSLAHDRSTPFTHLHCHHHVCPELSLSPLPKNTEGM